MVMYALLLACCAVVAVLVKRLRDCVQTMVSLHKEFHQQKQMRKYDCCGGRARKSKGERERAAVWCCRAIETQ
jgi:hypothetical protein